LPSLLDKLVTCQVVEHGLGHLPFTEKQVITPTGSVYTGVDFCKKLCGVSIVRSGESMENALRACCKGIKIGKILIHRDGDNGKQLIYEKLPKDISKRHVLLLDPVLATGTFIYIASFFPLIYIIISPPTLRQINLLKLAHFAVIVYLGGVIEKLHATRELCIEEPILYVKMQVAALKLEQGDQKSTRPPSK
ncbi:uridine kinase-like protein 1, chloroplastic, partial [Telopea speciosissima]|uniref:uridine kinase-like protein 1, chloroplastic n=1 Tax=Telopea speciosissima TaxID=54955 RepID=UPI001CC376C3